MGDTLSKTTAARVRERLSYEPTTGVFRWASNPSEPAKVGQVAGCHDHKGYVLIGLDGVMHKAHRLAWLYHFNERPIGEIDHRNGNKSDNRIDNLRVVSRAVNGQNRRGPDVDASVPLLGVSRTRSRFRATIVVAKKQRHLGVFSTADEAHAAYVKAKRELHAGCTL